MPVNCLLPFFIVAILISPDNVRAGELSVRIFHLAEITSHTFPIQKNPILIRAELKRAAEGLLLHESVDSIHQRNIFIRIPKFLENNYKTEEMIRNLSKSKQINGKLFVTLRVIVNYKSAPPKIRYLTLVDIVATNITLREK